jgi:hypothetical protein
MSEPHARNRRAVPRRKRLIQETFIATAEEVAAVAERVEPAAGAGSYRGELAAWPLKWRERWGRRANALEDQGMSWRLAELTAFNEVDEERRSKADKRRNLSIALAARN